MVGSILYDHVVFFLEISYAFRSCGMLFTKSQKHQFNAQKLLKPWHKKKTKFVWYVRSYFTLLDPCCISPIPNNHLVFR